MTTESRVRVRYAETDQMSVAHHSSYVAWLELARVDWLRAAGLDYAEIERSGVFFPVTELHLRYKKPARFDDWLTVEAFLAELASRRFTMKYRVLKGKELVAEAETVHVVQDASGRARRLPDDIRAVLENALRR
ncbi:acyl-CoA thioesterase [Oceanithermus sp.]